MNTQSVKKRKKFNVIDVLILVLILAVIAALLYFFVFRGSFSGNDVVSLEYNIKLDIIDNRFHGNVVVGDLVTDTVKAYALGQVISVDYSPAVYTELNQLTGELMEYEYPDHEQVNIKVRADAKLTNGQYSLGGYPIAVGTRVHFRVPNFVSTGFCTSIIEVPAENDDQETDGQQGKDDEQAGGGNKDQDQEHGQPDRGIAA